MTTLTIKRVGENQYVSYLSGCVVGGSYTMQLRFAPPVVSPWEYAGVFIATDGTITTWEWNIPNPTSEYPYELRFVYDVDGSASNIVTIDPLNPPPINGEPPPPPPSLPSWIWLIPVALLAVVGIAYYVTKKS